MPQLPSSTFSALGNDSLDCYQYLNITRKIDSINLIILKGILSILNITPRSCKILYLPYQLSAISSIRCNFSLSSLTALINILLKYRP
jgi:hypothetical protein